MHKIRRHAILLFCGVWTTGNVVLSIGHNSLQWSRQLEEREYENSNEAAVLTDFITFMWYGCATGIPRGVVHSTGLPALAILRAEIVNQSCVEQFFVSHYKK